MSLPRIRTRLLYGFVALLVFAPAYSRAAGPPPQASTFTPDAASVQRYGPAYRYPQAGWIVLHIEGAPYDRGYQHGRLLAPEIAEYVKTLAQSRSPSAAAEAWNGVRTLVDALFLRRYEPEYLEEMKGIADGAAAAGAKFDGRAIDLVDVVALNSEMETSCLASALEATATGLEGKRFNEPQFARPKAEQADHCSAFAATGPATADGKVVFGHITMFTLYMVRFYNVWLDVKPEKGHRVLMQSYPGGIQSGMDYYYNDAGLLVTETTIHQTKFDIEGKALASRIRRVLQDASSIDQAVEILEKSNNGLYTNEWLLADTNTNEIAMFELGTHKTKLWRSSKNEWFGGTTGFYWGCNNAKDLDVRLETVPSVDGKPANVVFHPSDRDKKWIELYQKNKGKIGVGFGFEAFTTPPLAAFPSCDAKFTTTAMAKELKTWALFGPPLGRTWEPSESERARYSDIRPLVANDWTVLRPDAPPVASEGAAHAVDLATVNPEKPAKPKIISYFDDPNAGQIRPTVWHGTILPKTDADIWLAAAFADYQEIVALENSLKARAEGGKLAAAAQDQIDLALFAPKSRYLAAVRHLGKDVPLSEIKSEFARDEWYRIASGKGVLLLAALRDAMGSRTFDAFMDKFGRANAGRPVSTVAFLADAEKAHGKPLAALVSPWLDGEPALKPMPGPTWSIDSFEEDPDRTLIVYGTTREMYAQREAATHLQQRLARRWGNYTVPIKADTDVTDEDIVSNHLLLIGRPDSNSIASKLAKQLAVTVAPGSFVVRGDTYAHPDSAVVVAGENPKNSKRSLVLFAGLSADATWRSVQRLYDRGSGAAPVVLMAAGHNPRPLPVSEPKSGAQVASGAKIDVQED
jgi:hypothetical protein